MLSEYAKAFHWIAYVTVFANRSTKALCLISRETIHWAALRTCAHNALLQKFQIYLVRSSTKNRIDFINSYDTFKF